MTDEPKFVSPVPPIGTPIQWFPHGQRTKDPLPALVFKTTDRGTISVLFIQPSGIIGYRETVWHVDDPTLARQGYPSRSISGCWDYLPVQGSPPWVRLLLERVAGLEATVDVLRRRLGGGASDRPERDEDQIVADILRLATTSTVPEVAAALHVSPQKVNAILRREKTAKEAATP